MINKRLKIHEFRQFVSEKYYSYSFKKGVHLYEINIEICDRGFCIALYHNNSGSMELMYPKTCTNEDYHHDIFGMSPRSPDTWRKALEIANKIYALFMASHY